MTHADALNKILAHSCPRDTKDGISTFHLDLCCHEVLVRTRGPFVAEGPVYLYDILSVDLVDYSKRSPVRTSEL